MGNEDNQVQEVIVRRVIGTSVPVNDKQVFENPIFHSNGFFNYVVLGPFKVGSRIYKENKFKPHFNSKNSGLDHIA